MRKQDIHTAILQVHEHESGPTEDWKMLVDKYPYFNIAHVMLAKASHDNGDLDYNDHLQMAALYTGNRKALYDLIIGASLRKKITEVDEEMEVSEEVAVEEETDADEQVLEVEATESESPEAELTEVDETEPDIAQKEEEEESVTEEEETEVENDSETASPKKLEIEELDEMEKEILYEAVYSSIEQEVQEGVGDEIDEESEVDGKESSAQGMDEQELSPYAKWLKQRSKAVHFREEEAITEEQAKGLDEKDLIDRFIKNDPKISVKKDDLFSNENLGKMSLVEDEDFVTETLAKVYARQGKINKAIKAYKKLSLKYPEKSIYFANQLKKLQNKT